MSRPTPNYLRRLRRAQRVIGEYDSSLDARLVKSDELLGAVSDAVGEVVPSALIITSALPDCLEIYDDSRIVAEFYFLRKDPEVRSKRSSFSERAEEIQDQYNSEDGKVRVELRSFANPIDTNSDYGALVVDLEKVEGYQIRDGQTLGLVIEHEARTTGEDGRFYVTCEDTEFANPIVGMAEDIYGAFNDFFDKLIHLYESLAEIHDGKLAESRLAQTKKRLTEILKIN